jgi:hypothetical protein
MCPVCLATALVIASKVASTGGVAAIAIKKLGVKNARDRESSRSDSENKGDIRWQQAKRETRNTGKDISR